MESTECQIACNFVSHVAKALKRRVRTHHGEQSLWPQITIAALELALLVQAPDRLDTARKLFTADAADGVPDGANAKDAALEDYRYGMGEGSHPVAKITMSAGSSLPSSNLSPFGVNVSICGPLFNLILPSMMSWLAPTSVRVKTLNLRSYLSRTYLNSSHRRAPKQAARNPRPCTPCWCGIQHASSHRVVP